MNEIVLNIQNEIKSFENVEKIPVYLRFFKTGVGEYGEGDQFLGLTTPQIKRIVSKYYKEISLKEVEEILHSPIHEFRMFALSTLVMKYEKYPELQSEIFNIYLKNTKWINNWDLVDVTAPKIIGHYLLKRDRSVLYTLANSTNLWEQRISIMSTFTFLRNMEFEDTFKISDILMNHKHDLIHKAVGWMLREVGKRSINSEKEFLKTRYKNMPRTMLRYAIEKFEENLRQQYLKGII